MRIKPPPDRLNSEKVKTQWITSRQKSFIFRPELNEFNSILQALPRDKASELAEYTANFFKLKNVKTVIPPATSQAVAAEILIDELEIYLNHQKSLSFLKKFIAWKRLCQISINQTLKQ